MLPFLLAVSGFECYAGAVFTGRFQPFSNVCFSEVGTPDSTQVQLAAQTCTRYAFVLALRTDATRIYYVQGSMPHVSQGAKNGHSCVLALSACAGTKAMAKVCLYMVLFCSASTFRPCDFTTPSSSPEAQKLLHIRAFRSQVHRFHPPDPHDPVIAKKHLV